MITREESGHSNLFLVGLMAGTAIGAGLALAFAPRMASELRDRVTASATDLGEAASRGYQQVSTRVADVIENVTERAQTVRGEVAAAIERGAREVEQFADAAKSSAGGSRS
jgi:gas vesicle protein